MDPLKTSGDEARSEGWCSGCGERPGNLRSLGPVHLCSNCHPAVIQAASKLQPVRLAHVGNAGSIIPTLWDV